MASNRESDAGRQLSELTIRGIILGGLLTVIFTAANVYLGLKLGITFATSIPAAVISMAVLRLVSNSTIQENNIVQTIASAAGTLSAIIFVLPGLVMIGYWHHFPYWLSVAVIGLGGILGVMYSVPLRRALVTNSELPYPEGVAAAEVLKVGAGVGGAEENRRGLAAIVLTSVLSAVFYLLAKARLVGDTISTAFRAGAGASGFGASLSMALIGVGHLVGLAVGCAMLVGILISWVWLMPTLTAGMSLAGPDGLVGVVNNVFRTQIRFIGAGTMLIAAVWTLLKVIGPVTSGVLQAIRANKARRAGEALPLTERDLPITLVASTIVASMLPIGLLLVEVARQGGLHDHVVPLIALSLGYIIIAGLIIAAITGYMAGLIGASNSPVSGVGILTALGISLILAGLFGGAGAAAGKSLVAFSLIVTAVIFGVATIANDNLQDLKTGQLVGATPWRQQVALVIGVVFGALVIPPILDLMNAAFGFAGAPGAGANALNAPQAALISSITQGILGGNLDWSLIGRGAAIGAGVVLVDEVLRKTSNGKFSLPPLAVGMGMYLPMEVDLFVVVGAVLGWLYDRWARGAPNPGFAERLGTLMATGLIVGESLMGVIYAGMVAGAERAGSADSSGVLALFGENQHPLLTGIPLFAAIIAGAYLWTRSKASVPLPAEDPAAVDIASAR